MQVDQLSEGISAAAPKSSEVKYLVDIVFVVGPYKSGTSLAAGKFSLAGFFNPAQMSNPRERGYGTTVARYHTNECAWLRRVNDQLMPSHAAREKRRLILNLNATGDFSPRRYLSNWRDPIVLKDPRFVYTLPAWLKAADLLHRRILVCFTSRESVKLEQAWRHAPFTRSLLRVNAQREMSDWTQRQFALCRDTGIPRRVFSLELLRPPTFNTAVTKLAMAVAP
jgi:hypothetical protein